MYMAMLSSLDLVLLEGRRVLVIERDFSKQNRIVGELLQPGGYLKLIELGLEGDRCSMSSWLRSLQRRVRLEQGMVTSLLDKDGIIKGVRYKTKEGDEVRSYAPLTIVCDGCFSNLPRSLCKPKVDVPSSFVGLVLENCDLPFANHGHVILADPSPILLYPISSSETRCLVDIPGPKLPPIANGEMSKYLISTVITHVAPQIPTKVREAFVAAVEKGNIRTMPNKTMPAYTVRTPGALLLGDAFNMRHPLTGGGMTVALADVVVLRDLLRPVRNFDNKEALSKYIEAFYTLRKSASAIIFPIIQAEGVRQVFFPRTISAIYRAPPPA
ncbi:unnamed protein product [Cochlearia groenlandica]